MKRRLKIKGVIRVKIKFDFNDFIDEYEIRKYEELKKFEEYKYILKKLEIDVKEGKIHENKNVPIKHS